MFVDYTSVDPVSMTKSEIDNNTWLENDKNYIIKLALFQYCNSFPSILFSYSATNNNNSLFNTAIQVAYPISKLGINVFISDHPTPISALSHAITTRNFPLGLYLTTPSNLDVHSKNYSKQTQNIEPTKDCSDYILIPIGINGGPLAETDINHNLAPKFAKKPGVIGTTDLISPYLKSLQELLDPFVDLSQNSVLASIYNPFTKIKQAFETNPKFKIFTHVCTNGFKAIISNDGQSLKIVEQNNDSKEVISAEQIAENIVKYLVNHRKTGGTIISSNHNSNSNSYFSVNGISLINLKTNHLLDLCCKASYIDLLLGYDDSGVFIHQGFGSFGDAFLSLAYLLESKYSEN